MTPDQVLLRARCAMGRGCVYKLGAGGRRPLEPQPWVGAAECDCSGFVAWCLGVDRHTDNPWYKRQNGGWLETTAIVHDCATRYGFFDVELWNQAKPGMLVVYGDTVVDGQRRQGHVGIISEVDLSGPAKAIHCSKGNWRKTGDAIQETGVTIWSGRKDAIVAKCAFVEFERAA